MNPKLVAILKKLREHRTLSDEEIKLLNEFDQQNRAASEEDIERRCEHEKLTTREAPKDKKDVVGTIVGRPANYNVLSRDMGGWKERIRSGAFTESLAKTEDEFDVRALLAHDSGQILGRRSAGTLAIAEDRAGLEVAIFPLDTTIGRDTYMNVRAGNLDAMSFGMKPTKTEWGRDKGGLIVRELVKINLSEVSVVTWAAYPQTELSARALEEFHREETRVAVPVAILRRRQEQSALERRYYGDVSSDSGTYPQMASAATQASYAAAEATRKARAGNADDQEEACRLHGKACAAHKAAAKAAPDHHAAVADEHAAMAKMHAKK